MNRRFKSRQGKYQEFKFREFKITNPQKIAKAVRQLHLGQTPGGTPMSAHKRLEFVMMRCRG